MKKQLVIWCGIVHLATAMVGDAQEFEPFLYTTNCSTIEVTGYLGTGGVVNILGTINGLSVVAIRNGAFDTDCRITRITIPASVTNIGDLGFSVGRKVTAFDVDMANKVYSSVDGVLFDKGQSSLVQFPGGKKIDSYSIPPSVTRIGHTAFDSCTSLTSVTIPSSVTNIGVAAFWRCTSLTNIMIPINVTSVGSSAFLNCTSLTSVTMPKCVTTIEDRTFFLCCNLASLSIPNNITKIGNFAFHGCVGLTSIYFQGDAPSCGEGAFGECPEFTVYYRPNTRGWGATFAGRQTAVWEAKSREDGPYLEPRH